MASFKTQYVKQQVLVKESLTSRELNNVVDFDSEQSINSILLNKIKNKIGNKCNENGFIDRDSLQIMSRSMGKINSSHFNGDISYNVSLEANVCLPVQGSKLKCKVIGKNKIGVYALAEPIHIILAAVHHEDSSVFDQVEKDDTILVEVINYNFKLNSDNIRVIGKLLSKTK